MAPLEIRHRSIRSISAKHAQASRFLQQSPFTITADLALTDNGKGNGVVVTQGGRFGGYALYFKAGRPIFHYNAIGERQFEVASSTPVAAGNHQVEVRFDADEPKLGTAGTLVISVDQSEVARGRIDRTLADFWFTEGFDIGRDTMTPVTDDYSVEESAFNGAINKITVQLR
jgi:arylsulfatase